MSGSSLRLGVGVDLAPTIEFDYLFWSLGQVSGWVPKLDPDLSGSIGSWIGRRG